MSIAEEMREVHVNRISMIKKFAIIKNAKDLKYVVVETTILLKRDNYNITGEFLL